MFNGAAQAKLKNQTRWPFSRRILTICSQPTLSLPWSHLTAINCFSKKLHLKCSTRPWIRIWLSHHFFSNREIIVIDIVFAGKTKSYVDLKTGKQGIFCLKTFKIWQISTFSNQMTNKVLWWRKRYPCCIWKIHSASVGFI